jgi:hypothetical protein
MWLFIRLAKQHHWLERVGAVMFPIIISSCEPQALSIGTLLACTNVHLSLARVTRACSHSPPYIAWCVEPHTRPGSILRASSARLATSEAPPLPIAPPEMVFPASALQTPLAPGAALRHSVQKFHSFAAHDLYSLTCGQSRTCLAFLDVPVFITTDLTLHIGSNHTSYMAPPLQILDYAALADSWRSSNHRPSTLESLQVVITDVGGNHKHSVAGESQCSIP